MIQNPIVFPEHGRHIVSPEGHLYYTGGYYNVMRLFSKNNFIFDEHRSLLVPLQNMNVGRADHAILYFKGSIYVFGGMNFKEIEGSNEVKTQV